MEKIEVHGRTYYGEKMFIRQIEDITFNIYSLNIARGKYLVLRKEDEKVVDFVVTGAYKLNALLELIERNTELEGMRKCIEEEIAAIEQRCRIKALKRINIEKYKKEISAYYDENYPTFIFLGLRFSDIGAEKAKSN